MTTITLGVDVGGTTTAVGAVTGEGAVLFDEHAPTHDGGPASAERTIVGLIDSARAEGPPLHALAGRLSGLVPMIQVRE